MRLFMAKHYKIYALVTREAPRVAQAIIRDIPYGVCSPI